MTDWNKAFSDIFDSKQPYGDYQLTPARCLLEQGRSVILQAPTGSGKTFSALLPFIYAHKDGLNSTFPTKCIYAVPMRVLAHQFFETFDAHRQTDAQTVKHSIITGDQPDDRRFEGDLVFCTIDQFLSSYLTMPYSLPNRLANFNAGAMVGAYIVCDEFHLLDPQSTLPSTLYALKQLSQIAPILLMTATFSATMLTKLASELNAEAILVSAEEARNIETQNGRVLPRRRIWRTANALLTSEAILSHHNRRSLALCNTVHNAQELYRALRDHPNRGDTEVLLLHSRFLPEDRQKTETKLKELFGKDTDRNQGSVIAVATQTIEVGLDITSEVLHTELAPASALIQRAGRCARYPGEQGEVIVYPVETYAPYSREKEKDEMETDWGWEMKAAYEWLTAHSGEVFDFSKEQEFINAVATPRDGKVLDSLSAGRIERKDKIHQVLVGAGTPDHQRLLVRDADSRKVLIHSSRKALLKDPYGAIGFNLPLGTLYGMFKQWSDRSGDFDWRVMKLIEDKPARADKNEDNRADYGWEEVFNSQIIPTARVLLVNSELAGYKEDEGFVSEYGNTEFQSTLSPEAEKQTREGASYKRETYERHIELVIEAFEELSKPELLYPARALERQAGWPEGSVLRTARLICLLHDVGKLDWRWQGWARAYQAAIGEPVEADIALGHTHSEWGNQTHYTAEKAVSAKNPKPHHAGEGAYACAKILAEALGRECHSLWQASLTAIVRHHTPFACDCQAYRLEAQAKSHILHTLRFVPENIRNQVNLNNLVSEQTIPPLTFSGWLSVPSDDWGWLAYTLLARALRRADQEGTARGSK